MVAAAASRCPSELQDRRRSYPRRSLAEAKPPRWLSLARGAPTSGVTTEPTPCRSGTCTASSPPHSRSRATILSHPDRTRKPPHQRSRGRRREEQPGWPWHCRAAVTAWRWECRWSRLAASRGFGYPSGIATGTPWWRLCSVTKHDLTGVGLDRLRATLAAGVGRRRPDARSRPPCYKLDQRLDASIPAQVVADYEAGMPTTQLTGKYGLSKTSVLRLLHEAATEMRRQPFSDQEVDDAVRLCASGLSVATVGSRLGAHQSKVWRASVARGVVLRPPRNRPPASRKKL